MILKTKISDNPVLKIARYVQVLRIEYMDFITGEAKILFRLTHESKGVEVGITKDIWAVISNKNKVTSSGVVVNTKNLKPVKVKDKDNNDRDETAQEYKDRLDRMKKEGTREFDFWWENGKDQNLEHALTNGILLLDTLKYFD